MKIEENSFFSKISNIKKFCFFLCGLFCTMPVFNISGLNFYNYPLILYIIISLSRRKLFFHKKIIGLYFLLISFFISSLFSFSVVPRDWAVYSLRFSLKISILMFIILTVSSDEDLIMCRDFFLKGVFYAAFFQLFWIIIQQAFYSIRGIDLNLTLFGVATPMQNGGIAVTGLSWERADAIIALIIGIILSDNQIVKLLFMIGILMTASRTGIGIIIALLIYDIASLISKNKIHYHLRISTRKLFVYLGIILLLFFIIRNDQIRQYFNYTIIRFQRLFTGGNDYSVDSTQVDGHVLYYQWLLPTLRKLPLMQKLIGCGTGVSGWVYVLFYNLSAARPWGIETDFVNLLFGNGIMGTLIYYYDSVKIFWIQKNAKLKKILFVLLVGTFMYSFLGSSISVILMILCSPYNNLQKNTEDNKGISIK